MPAKQILFIFGDSITYGEWDSTGGWANRLRSHYDKQVLPLPTDYVISYNLGIPSDTSTGVAERLAQETQSRLAPNPDPDNIQFLIAIGANDSRWLIDENRHGVEKDEFKANLKSITKSARAFTNNITFVGLLPCIEEKVLASAKRHQWVEHFDNQSITAYNNMIKQYCLESELNFIDLKTHFNNFDYDALFDDGLHPNDNGHALISDIIIDHLNKSAQPKRSVDSVGTQ